MSNLPVSLSRTGSPTFMWAYPYEVEQAALDQIRRVSELPWVRGIRIMPDVHYGKGFTVGSVIAMEQAVAPAAVGVDIGCTDADSEFLSPLGWRRIADYAGEKVMQYDPDTGLGTFVYPERYIVRDQEEFLHFNTKYGINQMLTEDHRVLAWKITGRNRRREMVVLSAAELREEHERLALGAKYEFETSFIPVIDNNVEMTTPEIQLQVAISADGSIDKNRVVFRLKKDRKIERLRSLLDACGISFSVSLSDATRISFVPPILTKSLDIFWGASVAQLKVISDEVLLWDGNFEDECFFTRVEAQADFVQYAFTASGYRAVKRADTHKDGEIDYRVFRHKNTKVGLGGSPKSSVKRIAAVDGKAYCFTVPSGFWVMRRGGNVVMTGNCGTAAVRTSLTLEDLPDDLSALRAAIESAIPVGFHQYSDQSSIVGGTGDMPRDSKLSRRFATMAESFSELKAQGIADRFPKALSQCGTLGGGNHFIELCADDENRIWITLHSGSRNIGKEIADRHINVAKGLEHNQFLTGESRDLAVFLAGSPEMDAYMSDLYWAQDYALLNRQIMLATVQQILFDYFQYVPGVFDRRSVVFDERIQCHHNYVSEESYADDPYDENSPVRDLIVTRKGAIAAYNGSMGLIPGSMGTGSYIVRGLGNLASYQSASHGAGRRMSRGQAKRTFTVEDLAAQTDGVECRKDSGIIDEIPAAYKDLGQVMANQSDLVEIVNQLTTYLCVKG